MREKIDGRPTSNRKQEDAGMLETVLTRSGVREVMRGGWRGKDQGLDAYRSAAKTTARPELFPSHGHVA